MNTRKFIRGLFWGLMGTALLWAILIGLFKWVVSLW